MSGELSYQPFPEYMGGIRDKAKQRTLRYFSYYKKTSNFEDSWEILENL
jgi:hypothetical protein